VGARSELVLTHDRVVSHDRMLERVQKLLPSNFVRIHKSLIVDSSRVEQLVTREGSRYEVVLRGGVRLPVGRTKVRGLRRILTLP
jgi:DNA-binding LytR/AlgR family response regulator